MPDHAEQFPSIPASDSGIASEKKPVFSALHVGAGGPGEEETDPGGPRRQGIEGQS